MADIIYKDSVFIQFKAAYPSMGETVDEYLNHHIDANHFWFQPEILGLDENKTYDFNDTGDRLSLWTRLKYEPYFNLDMMALTLQYEIDMHTAPEAKGNDFDRHDYSTYSQKDITRTLAYYNGEWSYGEAVYEYYEIFDSLIDQQEVS